MWMLVLVNWIMIMSCYETDEKQKLFEGSHMINQAISRCLKGNKWALPCWSLICPRHLILTDFFSQFSHHWFKGSWGIFDNRQWSVMDFFIRISHICLNIAGNSSEQSYSNTLNIILICHFNLFFVLLALISTHYKDYSYSLV